jgi:hypothetical protein
MIFNTDIDYEKAEGIAYTRNDPRFSIWNSITRENKEKVLCGL